MTSDQDPHHHAKTIRLMLDEIIQHLREDVQKMNEAKAQAMFETAAEVLTGLKTAFEHYEANEEAGMRHSEPV